MTDGASVIATPQLVSRASLQLSLPASLSYRYVTAYVLPSPTVGIAADIPDVPNA